MIFRFKKTGWVREGFEDLHEPTFDPIIICHDMMEHEPKRYAVHTLNDEFLAIGRSLHLRGMAFEKRTGGSYVRWVKAIRHDLNYVLSFDVPLYKTSFKPPRGLKIETTIDRMIHGVKAHKNDLAVIKKLLIEGYIDARRKYGDNEESATKMVLDMADYLQKCPMRDLRVMYDGRVWRVIQ